MGMTLRERMKRILLTGYKDGYSEGAIVVAILQAVIEALPEEHHHSDKSFNEDGTPDCACDYIDGRNDYRAEVINILEDESTHE